jgi:hypothetical protein
MLILYYYILLFQNFKNNNIFYLHGIYIFYFCFYCLNFFFEMKNTKEHKNLNYYKSYTSNRLTFFCYHKVEILRGEEKKNHLKNIKHTKISA